MTRSFVLVVVLLVVSSHSALAQQRSAKRGIGWDEKTQTLTDAPIEKMAPGISWLYNWAVSTTATPSNIGIGDEKMAFLPMCWNASFDEGKLRQYLNQHQGEVKYLLAFNEPNLSWTVGGSAMTPQQTADAWPRVKQVAADYGLEIVAPALNFTGDQVGGKVWEPFAWYDEFLRLLTAASVEPAIDYLCFHSYMNWYSAVNWVTTEYFYTDKEDSDLFHVNNKGKYPYLVKYLEDYKTAHGHFPRMFLTEFCSWEGDKDGYTSSVDNQIDQMVQKVQKLELSDLVAGYAWFMANTSQAPTAYPYNSIFQGNNAASELSTLGQVYVYMSSFDKEKWYTPGETILAKDYINASMDGQVPKVRPNTEAGSDIPLQVEWQGSSWTAYQFDVPADGSYWLTLHMKSTAANGFRIYENALGAANKRHDTTLPSTNGQWQDVTTEVTLKAGHHTYLLYNLATTSLLLNSLHFDSSANGIAERQQDDDLTGSACYDLQGRRYSAAQLRKGIYIRSGKKYIVR